MRLKPTPVCQDCFYTHLRPCPYRNVFKTSKYSCRRWVYRGEVE